MSPLTKQLVLSEPLFEALRNVKRGAGLLYGISHDGKLEALGLGLCKPSVIETKILAEGSEANMVAELMETLDYLRPSLPGGVNIVGVFAVDSGESCLKTALGQACVEFLSKDLFGTDMPARLLFDSSSDKVRVNLVDSDEEVTEIEYSVSPLPSILKPYLVVRVKGGLLLNMENSMEGIQEEFKEQVKRAASEAYTFLFRQSGVYLKTNCQENGLSGIGNDKPVKQLIGKSDDGKKKKKGATIEEMEVLEAEILVKAQNYSIPGQEDDAGNLALVLQHRKREHDNVCLPVRIDCLSLVDQSSPVLSLYSVLVESLRRQLLATEFCLISELNTTKKISQPQTFHFSSPVWGKFITLVYPKNVSDTDLETSRSTRHEVLGLQTDMPFFHRGCKHVFPADQPANAPLINPHEGLLPTGVTDPEISLVKGRYSYHHYMQDNFDDNGWGCAYRSLQTVVSWFRWQGYTDVPVPTHATIQKCLIDIGDKPASFLGSRQWIGSTEVSFCLETLLGVTSRILSVSSGEELCCLGDELLRHFDTQGTPIMIGGGVLAHTILGVALEGQTIRFLVLDPHYTAGEDLPVIQSKGWCGWKGPDFWVKNAFYNLCMPQRPKCL